METNNSTQKSRTKFLPKCFMIVNNLCWKTKHSVDQHDFRRGTGIDQALAVLETAEGVEWNSEIWFENLDLTKAFDRGGM